MVTSDHVTNVKTESCVVIYTVEIVQWRTQDFFGRSGGGGGGKTFSCGQRVERKEGIWGRQPLNQVFRTVRKRV
jgi:hypothetical protein